MTKSEYEILDLMWREGRALSASEINRITAEKSWSDTSIHAIINLMLEKELIELAGMEKSGKVYGRLFAPCFSRDDYLVELIRNNPIFEDDKSAGMIKLLGAMLSDKALTADTLRELDKMIQEKKKELKV